MIISYNWLQKHFNKDLPAPHEVADLLNKHSFEVEGVDEINTGTEKLDTVFDIDILPNRSHDCLSHTGIAKEIAVLTGLELKKKKKTDIVDSLENTGELNVIVEEEKLCPRYIGVLIKDIKVGPSPDWLKESLESIGQKSINNIVDITNYVMFNTGQPVHAFDADKMSGRQIIVRRAKEGEKITTLDNKEVILGEDNLVIADMDSPLAIAGVKGGSKAEVDDNTKDIILECANFNPTFTRKTSRGLNILTDSSKRFENEITPELAGIAMNDLIEFILEFASTKETNVITKTDFYPKKRNKIKVGVSIKDITKRTGVVMSEDDIENVLNRFGFDFEKINPQDKVESQIKKYLGAPYKSGASVSYDAPEIFDCSSLTAYIYVQAGIAIPRISVDQFVFGREVKEEDIQVGDLIFSNTGIVLKTGIYTETVEFLPGTKVEHGVDHVGMYVGEGKVLHTSSVTDRVVIEEIKTAKMFQNIVGYKRMIDYTENRFVVTVPHERLDLRIKEDLVEEIIRIYGYGNISTVAIEKIKKPKVNKNFYYSNKIREVLSDLNFVEVYNYSFGAEGVVELESSLASDKNFMRTNLSNKLKQNLDLNIKNAPLLGLSEVKIFEIGRVFPRANEEYISFALGVQSTAGKKQKSKIEKEIIDEALRSLSEIFNTKFSCKENIFEVNIQELIEKLPEISSYEDVLKIEQKEIKYKPFSPYPFVLRDIAVWVKEGDEKDVIKIIKENGGELLMNVKLFDTYEPEKEDRVSYAFNLVFQSNEKTLQDTEITEVMRLIEYSIKEKGWEVR